MAFLIRECLKVKPKSMRGLTNVAGITSAKFSSYKLGATPTLSTQYHPIMKTNLPVVFGHLTWLKQGCVCFRVRGIIRSLVLVIVAGPALL